MPEEVHAFLKRELDRVVPMLNAHPSFVLLSLGNELIKADGHGLNELVNRARELDPTRLYGQYRFRERQRSAGKAIISSRA